MPRPGLSAVHVDQPLTNISVAHLQRAENFACMNFFPRVPVEKRSDVYYVFNRADFNRDEAEVRAPGTESAGSGYGLDTDQYRCDVWAFHKDVDDQSRANADSVLRPFENAAQFVTHKILIRKERDWVSNFLSTGVWGVDKDISSDSTQWTDSANSDPVQDIRKGKTEVMRRTGFSPNKMVLGVDLFHTLIDHPDIVERIKYGQTRGAPASANAETLAAILGLDQVVVTSAVYNKADQGQTEDSDFIADSDKALLAYAPDSPGLETPSAGYMFSWRGFMGGVNDMGFAVRRFRMEEREAERVEGQGAWDHRKVAGDLGYLLYNAI